MERLGLGPAACAARNPRLVYGRMTVGGTGCSHRRLARPELRRPHGIVSARRAVRRAAAAAGHRGRRRDGRAGPRIRHRLRALVDARAPAGADGSSTRRSSTSPRCSARWCSGSAPGSSTTRSPACSTTRRSTTPMPRRRRPDHDRCSEPQFYALLLAKLGLERRQPGAQYDRAQWLALKARLTALFASRPRAHWCALLEGQRRVLRAWYSRSPRRRRIRNNVSCGIYAVSAAAPPGGLRAAAAPSRAAAAARRAARLTPALRQGPTPRIFSMHLHIAATSQESQRMPQSRRAKPAAKGGARHPAAGGERVPEVPKPAPLRHQDEAATSRSWTWKKMVLDGRDFVVRDAKTMRDLTRSILLQIILGKRPAACRCSRRRCWRR